jgi:hypothetical protein
MRRVFASRWTYVATKALGFGLLAGYLMHTGDFRVSLPWALAFPALALFVGWTFVALKLSEKFPSLNTYLLYPRSAITPDVPLSEDEWTLRQVQYLEHGMRGAAILAAPAEEGLVCVPVLLFGITPLSALLGGVVFGCLHLARFDYLACIAKAVIYALACYFLLPFGILTLALGHLLWDAVALAGLKVLKHKLSP